MRTPERTTRPLAARTARALLVPVAALLAVTADTAGQEPLRIVATLPTYAAIAREVAGDRVEIQAIARGDQDPHFVNPRPSFAAAIQRADLFISTGLDLELWVPALLDRANNPRVIEGAPGNVAAYAGITLLEVPEHVSRSGGDVHVFGNPHIHTDPVNAIVVAGNIAAALQRLDAAHAADYAANLADFRSRVLRRLFGDRLVQMLGEETLFDLARGQGFWEFAETQQYQGQPLTAYLGGWLAQAAPFRDQRVVCYHKNWAYFSARFRVPCAEFVEPQPGIPPSPGHVRDVIAFIQRERIPALLAANYFNRQQVERVADRAGIRAVIVPEHVEGAEGVHDYFALVDLWVTELAQAFRTARSPHPDR